jgi:hypothetical protein
MSTAGGSRAWHGSFELNPGEAGIWRIGPLSLLIRRETHQLLVAYGQTGDPSSPDSDVILPAPEALLSDFEGNQDADVIRSSYAFGQEKIALSLMPLLADRPVVLRPEEPLFVLPADEVTLFVSLPVWLSLTVGAEPVTLTEFPIFRPSDTWFGPNTWDGEVCYAGKVAPKTDVAQLAQLPHRCTTPIRIRNAAPESLQINRVRIPAHQLALFSDDRGHFWTQRVDLVRERSDDLAVLKISRNVPAEAAGALRIADPRTPVYPNVIVRAFESLIKVS